MTFEEFKESLDTNNLYDFYSPALTALWWAAKGKWEEAHNIAQEMHTEEGSWIHAYLHRVEGDLSNACYWYSRAGKPPHKGELSQEWEELVTYFLKND